MLPLLKCTLLPVTLTVMFKLQAACTFQFMCKHAVVKTHYMSLVTGITKVSNSKSTFSLTQGHGSRAI